MKAKEGKSSSELLKSKTSKTRKDQFPIVGIGASAGGLEALGEFFESMPSNSGMAFVVIQHLDPHRVGMMPELLQRITRMKVMQASDGLKVKPDCIYVIPPNKSMTLLHGALYLFDPVEIRGLRLPVDIFFRSLAEDQREMSIGIVLSGMGTDGSLGIKAIKEKNGTVLVQEPETAKFDGMPRSATASVIPDIVASAGELPVKLIDFLKIIPHVHAIPENITTDIGSLDKIIILLREKTGQDFSMYKKSTLIRRIDRRKGVHQIGNIQHYVRFLQENPQEREILFKEFLIGVTSFFRDRPVWEMLREKTLPSLLNELPDGYMLRAWVPGCSTGEEAYSLAIIFEEALEKVKRNKNLRLQIFATDIDLDAIDKARKGIFPPNIASDVSPERLNRFFIAENDSFRVKPFIREMIVFAPHSVIKDPPFLKLDILTCRNMLIYMESKLQEKLITLFHYCINPGGVMLLGTSETPGTLKNGFVVQEDKLKIFKRAAVNSQNIEFPGSFIHHKIMNAEKPIIANVEENIQTVADQIVIQRFAPPSVLVNEKGDIIYITGRTGKYLEPAAGKANWNIYAMAREGLREVLPAALRKALSNSDAVIMKDIRIGKNADTKIVDVTIQRIDAPPSIKGMVMIVFVDVHLTPEHENVIQALKHVKGSMRHKELEIDIKRYEGEMNSLREEMQSSQEELKSTNEELQSTNEELQLTNEELTTSKEEMQSLNEELQTVNMELQSKVNDYMRAEDDMNNLLNSTEIATLFLDKDLNIRRFTEYMKNIFKLRDTDMGRPYSDLVSHLKYPDLDRHARQVIKTLMPVETEIATHDGRWFNIRIMPYRTIDDRIEGLVMTFSDITKAKKLEIELRGTNDALKKDG